MYTSRGTVSFINEVIFISIIYIYNISEKYLFLFPE